MFYIDIRVLQLAETYDFKLEEEVEINVLIRQITVILFGKEETGVLFDLTGQMELCSELNLSEQGVRSGHTLLLFLC